MAARSGFFLSFEGLDGCGKSTQIDLLSRHLRESGVRPVIVQEPGGTPVGDQIRAVVADAANADLDPVAELLLYFASRVQNWRQRIRPALDEGRLVIADRFTDATVAYQGFGRGLGWDVVKRVDQIACPDASPDLTAWLDVSPLKALSRARVRDRRNDGSPGLMESQSAEFFERVRSGYEAVCAAEPHRVLRIDAAGSVGEVAARVRTAVLPSLRSRMRAPLP